MIGVDFERAKCGHVEVYVGRYLSYEYDGVASFYCPTCWRYSGQLSGPANTVRERWLEGKL